MIGASFALGLSALAQVEWTLSKPDGAYAPGETVEVTLVNNLGREIELPGSVPWWIEDSQGTALTCWVGTAEIVPLPSGELSTLRWDQKGCETEPGLAGPVPSGTYAAVIAFWDHGPGESASRRVELRTCFGIGGPPSASCRSDSVHGQPVGGTADSSGGCGSLGADALLVVAGLLGLRAIRGACRQKAMRPH